MQANAAANQMKKVFSAIAVRSSFVHSTLVIVPVEAGSSRLSRETIETGVGIRFAMSQIYTANSSHQQNNFK